MNAWMKIDFSYLHENIPGITLFCNYSQLHLRKELKAIGTKEKLIERFNQLPKDFTFDEAIKLLSAFGYSVHNKGATFGSRIRFNNEQAGKYIDIHRPHPGSILKE